MPPSNLSDLWKYTRIHSKRLSEVIGVNFFLDVLQKDNSVLKLECVVKLLFILRYLQEMFWRIEKCHSSVPQETCDILDRILLYESPVFSTENPEPRVSFCWPVAVFELLCADEEALQALGMLLPGYPDSAALEAACRAVALSLLRHHRRSCCQDKFIRWAEELRRYAQAAQIPSVMSRIDCEECLFALQIGDIYGFYEILKGWKRIEDDLYWTVRKAGLLAEAGDIVEAVAWTESVLQDISERTRQDCDHIEMLSREGWTLYLRLNLMRALQQSEKPPGGTTGRTTSAASPLAKGRRSQRILHDRVASRQQIDAIEKRLYELSVSRCDPRVDLHWLELRLNGGTDWDSSSDALVRPELAAIGLIEETGLPLFVGRFQIAQPYLMRAAQRFEPYDALTATALFLRIGAPRDTEGEPLNVARFQTMFRRERERGRERGLDGIGSALALIRANAENIHASLEAEGAAAGSRADRNVVDRALLTLTILTASVVYADDGEVAAAFDIALDYFGSSAISKVYLLHQPLSQLFVAVLGRLDEHLSLDQLLRLARLPIPGHGNFDPAKNAKGWVEPFRYVLRCPPPLMRTDPGKPPSAEEWGSAMNGLLRAGKIAQGGGRTRALRRLQVLRAWGVPAEDSFWTDVDTVASDAFKDLKDDPEFKAWQWLEFHNVPGIVNEVKRLFDGYFAADAIITAELLENVVAACSWRIADTENRERLYSPTLERLGHLADRLVAWAAEPAEPTKPGEPPKAPA